MAELYGKGTSRFEREHHTVFQSGSTTQHPHHSEWDCPLPLPYPKPVSSPFWIWAT